MDRTDITIKRTGMIGFIIFGSWLYIKNQNSQYVEIYSILLVLGAIISIMFWIKGEIEWGEELKKRRSENSYHHRTESTIGNTLGLIASIITIIGAIIYVLKVILLH